MAHSVLIVDDDPAMRLVISRCLAGYSTVCAGNGADGIRRLVEMRPCVAVLDYEMPVMDGHDFREVQKRVAPAVPIICITGHNGGPWLARLVGASTLHTKPFNIEDVRASVHELCQRPHVHLAGAAIA